MLLGDLSNNLLDFNQWIRFSTGDLNTSIKLITSYQGVAYIAIDQQGVYHFNGTTWTKQLSYPVLLAYAFLKGDETHVLLGGGEFLFMVNTAGEVTEILDALLTMPQAALMAEDRLWVADGTSGMISNNEGVWKRYVSNGPSSPAIFGNRYVNNTMVTIHGGIESDFSGSNSFKGVSVFNRGLWSLQTSQVDYITDLAGGSQGALFIASFGEGLEKKEVDGNSTILNTSNSPLQYVTALTNSPNGLWIANYGSAQSLHLLSAANELQSFSLTGTPARYPFELAADGSENIWMLIGAVGGEGGGNC